MKKIYKIVKTFLSNSLQQNGKVLRITLFYFSLTQSTIIICAWKYPHGTLNKWHFKRLSRNNMNFSNQIKFSLKVFKLSLKLLSFKWGVLNYVGFQWFFILCSFFSLFLIFYLLCVIFPSLLSSFVLLSCLFLPHFHLISHHCFFYLSLLSVRSKLGFETSK